MISAEKVTFGGWVDSVRLTNGEYEVVTLTGVGPRVIRYGRVDGPNAFHVIDGDAGATGDSNFRAYGGHRLWAAPEVDGRTAAPDNSPAELVDILPHGLRVVAGREACSGLRKELEISMAEAGSLVCARHRIHNENVWAVSLAPWALSIVANGGYVVVPQEPFIPHGESFLPARPLVLWTYTDMTDPRWRWGRRYLTQRQDDALDTPQKVGAHVSAGWVAHVTPGQALVKVFAVPAGAQSYPDLGCNFEAYTQAAFQELETLGPTVTLEPGEAVEYVEWWYLEDSAPIPDNDDALDEKLMPIVDRALSAVSSTGVVR